MPVITGGGNNSGGVATVFLAVVIPVVRATDQVVTTDMSAIDAPGCALRSYSL
jgi:hypothetical protein